MNKVLVMGNLTDNPASSTTADGTAVSKFTVAVERAYGKDKDGKRITDFFPVVAWRQLADICNKYLSKGRKVLIEGELQTRSYEDKEGKRHHVTEIKAVSIEFIGAKPTNEPQSNAGQADEYIDEYDQDMPF